MDTFDLSKFRVKVLLSFYSKCQGLLTSIIWSQTIAQDLGIDENKMTSFEATVRFLWNEFLIQRKALGEGYSSTYLGFDEVESIIVHPHSSTAHFPSNIAK